jgi:Holliday junction resolvase-like predicted endonuclease
MPKTGSKQQLGVCGEDLACAELERQGMQVLERSWRCRLGDPDMSVRTPSGLRVGVILEFRTDQPSAGYATARREVEHALEIEMLKQKVRAAQERHDNVLISARVEMYRGIINRGDFDQFALQLAQRPDDVASVVQLMREERDERRRQIIHFVLQMLNSGAIERWEIDDQVRAALNWLKESTENIIGSPGPDQIPTAPPGAARSSAVELPGGAELPGAHKPGQDASEAPSPPSDSNQ